MAEMATRIASENVPASGSPGANGPLDFSGLGGLRKISFLVFALLMTGTLPFSSFSITFSALFGGLAALFNLRSQERMVKAALVGPEERKDPAEVKRKVMASFYIRFILFGIALGIAIKAGVIHVVALMAGLSVTALAIFTWSLFEHQALRRVAIDEKLQ